LGHPSEFRRVSRIRFVTAPTTLNGGQPNFARCLAVSCAGTQYIDFEGFCPLTEFCNVHKKFTLRPSLAFSYIGSVATRHSSQTLQRGRELRKFRFSFAPPICRRAAITFGIRPHSSSSIKVQPLMEDKRTAARYTMRLKQC